MNINIFFTLTSLTLILPLSLYQKNSKNTIIIKYLAAILSFVFEYYLKFSIFIYSYTLYFYLTGNVLIETVKYIYKSQNKSK